MGYVILVMWGLGDYWRIENRHGGDPTIYLTPESCFEALSERPYTPDFGVSTSCMKADIAKRIVDMHMSRYYEKDNGQ